MHEINKLWYKIVLVIFTLFRSDIPLDFHDSVRVVPVKYLMYLLTGINTK